MIPLTDKIREQLDKGNFGCRIFVDFQKAYNRVDQNILIQKYNYYGERGTANKWFSSHLENRTQFVSVNGYSSDLLYFRCGVPQCSVFGPLLFLVYIIDLHFAIKDCRVHHFGDDTNLLNSNTGTGLWLLNWSRILPLSRSCHHRRCSVKRDVLGDFAGFVGGRRCCSLFSIKLLAWELAVLLSGDSSMGVFPVSFVKVLRAPILMSICQWQLLTD